MDPERSWTSVVLAVGEEPAFRPGDRVRVACRSPIGHYRVPTYLRGKLALVEAVIEPLAIDNEEEGYGRNAGHKLHYYRLVVAMSEIWSETRVSPADTLRIEVCENWLEGVEHDSSAER